MKRAGLGDGKRSAKEVSISECLACGAPLVGKMGITQMGLDFCNIECRDKTTAQSQAREEMIRKFDSTQNGRAVDFNTAANEMWYRGRGGRGGGRR